MKKNLMKKIVAVIFLCAFGGVVNAQNINFAWAKHVGGLGNEIAQSVATDANGNIFTVGFFSGTTDFDPGPMTANLTSLGGLGDMFITKSDAAGNFLWAKQIGGNRFVQPLSLVIDANGNILTIGMFQGTADFDPGSGTANLVGSLGTTNTYISKLDNSGNYVWAKQFGVNYCVGYDITVDGNGNVYTCGHFSGVNDFDPGNGTYNLGASNAFKIFVSKLDPSGGFLWAKELGNGGNNNQCSIALNSSGDVYTLGSFDGTADFDPGVGTNNLVSFGQSDIFLSKLTSTGTYIGAWQFGGLSSEFAAAMAIDNSGNIIGYGHFQGTADFNPQSGIANLTAVGGSDIFIFKLDASNNFVWAKQFEGNNWDTPTSVTTDYIGNVYLTGGFAGTSDFDPSSGIYNLVSAGNYDAFLAKLSSSGNFLWVKQLGGIDQTYSACVFVDGALNVYSTGYFNGVVDFDPGINSVNFSSGGIWDCYVHKMTQLTTKLTNADCGITQTALNQNLTCDAVVGATNYKYEITTSGFLYTFIRGNNLTNLDLTWIPGIGYGVVYNIRVSAFVGGMWTDWGPMCTVTTPTPPTTQLISNDCGITLTALNQQINCNPIVGATNYRYEITGPNFNSIYVRANWLTNFDLTWIAGTGYGVTYNIRVAAAVGGTWTAYGNMCTVTTPTPPTTQLVSNDCGITLTALNQQVNCNPIPGATNYRYEITGPNFNSIYVRANWLTNFDLTWVTGTGYGVTYNIRVAAAVGGTWTAYGNMCTVTTPTPPTTQLISNDCGITLTALNQQVNCNPIVGATNYRYEIIGPNFNSIYVRSNWLTNFDLTWVAGTGYGVTYNIRVAAAVGGTWTTYGNMCTITTPTPPTTQLNSSSCGITISTMAQSLGCDAVVGASNYRYEIIDQNNTSNQFIYYRGNYGTNFQLNWVSGIYNSTTYGIRVAAFVGGTWLAYGSSCNVVVPSSARPAKQDEDADITGIKNIEGDDDNRFYFEIYPNPTENNITINLNKEYSDIQVVVSNALGQEMSAERFSLIDKVDLKINGPAGVYFVTVISNDKIFRSSKIIKQ